jgi:hypothetical protein
MRTSLLIKTLLGPLGPQIIDMTIVPLTQFSSSPVPDLDWDYLVVQPRTVRKE